MSGSLEQKMYIVYQKYQCTRKYICYFRISSRLQRIQCWRKTRLKTLRVKCNGQELTIPSKEVTGDDKQGNTPFKMTIENVTISDNTTLEFYCTTSENTYGLRLYSVKLYVPGSGSGSTGGEEVQPSNPLPAIKCTHQTMKVMNKRLLIFTLFITCVYTTSLFAQDRLGVYAAAFYNLENLWDTVDDPNNEGMMISLRKEV